MSSGGGDQPTQTVTQRTDTSPWSEQQEPLKFGFGEAKRLYDSSQPQFFPGSTVVPFSPESSQALAQMKERATTGNPLLPQAQQYASQSLGGDFLQGNPFFNQAFQAQVKPMVEQYRDVLVPGISSAFSAGGRFGPNAAMGTAQGQAADSLSRALSDTAGKLAFQNYGAERGMQQEAAQFAPALAQADYIDPAQLGAVGAARETQAGSELNDLIQRWNFGQNSQANKLGQYMGLVGGGFGSQGASTQTVPFQRSSPALGLLGGGLAGAGLGQMLGINPIFGALGGAGLGLFGR